MLSYETIRKISNDEKNSQKLAALPEGFFDEVRIYLDKKAKMSEGRQDVWEIQSARRVLQDILDLREKKILTLALFNVRSGLVPDNINEHERGFFNTLVNNIKEFQTKRKETLEGTPIKMDVIGVLEDIQPFVGKDMKTYGPFGKGDVVSLPEEIAKLLTESGSARKIETGD
jgi:DNA replication initiation complex subunit (GINS family)